MADHKNKFHKVVFLFMLRENFRGFVHEAAIFLEAYGGNDVPI